MGSSNVKWNFKKDDIVQVIAGRERGKKGRVLALMKDEGRAKVEKLNMYKRHVRPDRKTQQGGILEREGSIHMSNLMLVCDKCGKGVRIRRKLLDNGKRVRACRKCGEVIDKT